MANYGVTFTREFRVEIEADNLETADLLARAVIKQFPPGTCKLLSVVAESAKTVTAGKAKRRRAS
jgi:hypothetical protein